MTTEAPILIFFTTNYMGTGYVATPSTRAVNGGVIREKPEESAGHPPAMRRPATRPDAKRLHNDVARKSSAAFPTLSRGRFLAAKIGANARREPPEVHALMLLLPLASVLGRAGAGGGQACPENEWSRKS